MSLNRIIKLKKINREMKNKSNMSEVGVYVWDGSSEPEVCKQWRKEKIDPTKYMVVI